ncbi:MAG TPA: dephospho-CoA kinase [Firmicutes bacterium]|nr:dephospho-CoA kinase [Bacillota bacterium]
MVTIGLTGGIASGKSTVAGMLQKKGALPLSADIIAREIVKPGEKAWQEIVDWLGKGILNPEGFIDRQRLGELVFNDSKARDRLNAITHPWIRQEILLRMEKLRQEYPQSALVMEVPLLIETGLYRMVDLVLLVYVNPQIQLTRLQQRDRLSARQAKNRLQAQMPLQEKRKYAHYIIDNSGSRRHTTQQVELFWRRMIKDG